MSELPEPIERLYGYFAAATIAHEAIYGRYSRIVDAAGNLEEARALLDEGTRIALIDMRAVAGDALQLARRYEDLVVLDPHGAAALLGDLAEALAAAEGQLKELQARQDEIAREFARLLDR